MIQNIFLPEKIGDYYIFSQKIAGIDITRSHIYASLLTIKGKKFYLKKQVIEPLNADTQNHQERVAATLPGVMKALGKVNHIRTLIPSTQVIFKELRLPFTSREKISLVIRFEIEPLLPFPLHQAVIDFIITSTNEQDHSAQVLVAAVQKQSISQHLSLFEQVGIHPDTITIDMFALYGLYTQIPAYASLQGLVMILDLDIHNTRIIALENQQLRIIRTLPDGLASIAKGAGTASQMKPAEILDLLVRFGVEGDKKSEKNSALATSLTNYFNKLQFALMSTASSLNYQTITKILLIGTGTEIKDIASQTQTIFQFPCEVFDPHLITQNHHYSIEKNISLTSTNMLSFATAIPYTITTGFDLRKEEFAPSLLSLFLKQTITTLVLIFVLFGSLITHTIIQSRRLHNEIKTSKDEVIEALKNRFPTIPEEEDDVEEVIRTAKEDLKKEEDIWLAFSSQARASFLEYLLELSTRINKAQLGFVPEQLTIVEGATSFMNLKAKVKDFDALKQLEKSLQQSKLFSYVESPRTPDFSMKITIARTM